MLAEQPIVVGMASNPEPDEPIWHFDGQRAVAGADPCRPEAADFLEMKGWMPGILLQPHVRLIGEILHVRRQGAIERPEVGRRVMSQRGVVLPAA